MNANDFLNSKDILNTRDIININDEKIYLIDLLNEYAELKVLDYEFRKIVIDMNEKFQNSENRFKL
jgi:hypothetical protein